MQIMHVYSNEILMKLRPAVAVSRNIENSIKEL